MTIHYAIEDNSQSGNADDENKPNTGDNDDQNNTLVTLAKTTVSTITNTTNGIEITWTPITNAAPYDIYRRIPNNAWAKIATVNGNVTKYEDTTVKNQTGTVYGYRIQAVNKEVKGEYSDEKTICCLSTPKLTSAKNNKKGQVTLKWKKVSNINGYEVQYSTDKNFKKATIKKVKSSKKSYVINKLKKKKTYYIRIRTYKKEGSTTYYSAWSSQKKVKIKK